MTNVCSNNASFSAVAGTRQQRHYVLECIKSQDELTELNRPQKKKMHPSLAPPRKLCLSRRSLLPAGLPVSLGFRGSSNSAIVARRCCA